jgi:hypothetical protein
MTREHAMNIVKDIIGSDLFAVLIYHFMLFMPHFFLFDKRQVGGFTGIYFRPVSELLCCFLTFCIFGLFVLRVDLDISVLPQFLNLESILHNVVLKLTVVLIFGANGEALLIF